MQVFERIIDKIDLEYLVLTSLVRPSIIRDSTWLSFNPCSIVGENLSASAWETLIFLTFNLGFSKIGFAWFSSPSLVSVLSLEDSENSSSIVSPLLVETCCFLVFILKPPNLM